MSQPATFICAVCDKTFPLGWSDQEARDEHSLLFPSEAIEDASLVCEGCFKKAMRWHGHPYWTEKLGYTFTHVIYNEHGMIVGWMIEGGFSIPEPCFPMPAPDLWPMPIGHLVKL